MTILCDAYITTLKRPFWQRHVVYYKNSNWGIYTSHRHWVVWGTGTTIDKDEVNRRDVCECDGWVCVLETIGAPSICVLETIGAFLKPQSGRPWSWQRKSVRDQQTRFISTVRPDLSQSTHRIKEEDTITKDRESDRCDLCRTLWIAEGRFRTEKELPEQTMGHIQHTCEALSAPHSDAHHQCWWLIHGELARLETPEWKFLCVSNEKCLQTIWGYVRGQGYPVIREKLHWDSQRYFGCTSTHHKKRLGETSPKYRDKKSLLLLWIDEAKANIKPIYECRCNGRL